MKSNEGACRCIDAELRAALVFALTTKELTLFMGTFKAYRRVVLLAFGVCCKMLLRSSAQAQYKIDLQTCEPGADLHPVEPLPVLTA